MVCKVILCIKICLHFIHLKKEKSVPFHTASISFSPKIPQIILVFLQVNRSTTKIQMTKCFIHFQVHYNVSTDGKQ